MIIFCLPSLNEEHIVTGGVLTSNFSQFFKCDIVKVITASFHCSPACAGDKILKEESMNTPNLLDAIRVVKENERVAAESYTNAATEMRALGNKNAFEQLFEQLSEFETFHYKQLTALERSLEEKGEFLTYEGKEFSLPPRLEVKFVEEANAKCLVEIITDAMKLEQQAKEAYADLAAQLTEDPLGHTMFLKLSEEESTHHQILGEAYWSVNQTGTWTVGFLKMRES
jgi:rubrerythrin